MSPRPVIIRDNYKGFDKLLNKVALISSVKAYKFSPRFLDYAATNGAIISFTRSLALNIANKKIRVNGVAPGPIWTPLIPATFEKEEVEKFGKDVPMERPGPKGRKSMQS